MSDARNSLRPASMADSEKTATSSHNVGTGDAKGVVETVVPAAAPASDMGEKTSRPNSANGLAAVDDDFEYPTKWKLAAITVALCLSVFCMALVSKLTALPNLTCSRCAGAPPPPQTATDAAWRSMGLAAHM